MVFEFASQKEINFFTEQGAAGNIESGVSTSTIAVHRSTFSTSTLFLLILCFGAVKLKNVHFDYFFINMREQSPFAISRNNGVLMSIQ